MNKNNRRDAARKKRKQLHRERNRANNSGGFQSATFETLRSLPRSIFKYEPLSLRSIQNLKQSSVFFNSPTNFNDPYDCRLSEVLKSGDEILERIKERLTVDPDVEQDIRELVNKADIEILSKIFNNTATNVIQRMKDIIAHCGICCFSENNDNHLMWAHYASSYRGFCLEFDTTFEPFTKLKPVEYSDAMPEFSLEDFALRPIKLPNQLWLRKSSFWSYEKEWRIMHGVANTQFSYPSEALKAIYFGPECHVQDTDLLCMIIYCQFPHAKLFFGSRVQNEFRITFEQKGTGEQYMPYAIAKAQGKV